MKTILLLAFLIVQSALGGTPTEALVDFKKSAQAKDFEATWKHAVKFDGVSDQVTEYLKDKVETYKKLEVWFKERKVELKKEKG